MTAFRRLEAGVLVAGQLDEADIEAAARAGVNVIVNNRPDGEEFRQPLSAVLAERARELGLAYRDLPVVAGRLSLDEVEAFGALLRDAREAGGEVLAFCRTGNRSACLWGLARARDGGDPPALVSAAAAAGHDLTGLLPVMEALAAKA